MVTDEQGETWNTRAARNQSMFRAVNERLTADAAAAPELVIACECADPECTDTLEISASEYGRLRENPNRFAVRDGHVYPDVEDVVDSSADFVVVAKRGEGGEVEAALHPGARE